MCLEGDEGRVVSMLDEAARTSGDLRSHVNPKYRYDERVADLQSCLELDGYRLMPRDGLQQIEPTVQGQAMYEDDLSQALRTCNLPDAANVQAALEQSANAFRHQPPELGFLTKAEEYVTFVDQLRAVDKRDVNNELGEG